MTSRFEPLPIDFPLVGSKLWDIFPKATKKQRAAIFDVFMEEFKKYRENEAVGLPSVEELQATWKRGYDERKALNPSQMFAGKQWARAGCEAVHALLSRPAADNRVEVSRAISRESAIRELVKAGWPLSASEAVDTLLPFFAPTQPKGEVSREATRDAIKRIIKARDYLNGRSIELADYELFHALEELGGNHG